MLLNVGKSHRKAREALVHGIHNEETVAELEYLGLSVRVINSLEESEWNIVYLEDLLAMNEEEILSIPNIGELGLAQIKKVLTKYHTLEEARARWYSPKRLRTKLRESIRQTNMRCRN